MKRWIRIVLIISLLLNVGLIAGFCFYRGFVRTHMFKLCASHYKAEARQLRYVLSELDPNNPVRISSLKELLQKKLKVAKRAADTWKKAADK